MPNPICPECNVNPVTTYGLGVCDECAPDLLEPAPQREPKPLFKRFEHFKTDTLLTTKALMQSFYRLDDAEKDRRIQHWLADVSSIYGISVPSFRVGDEAEAHGSGVYYPSQEAIVLPKYSIVSLLHEFRHHMQHSEVAPVGNTLNALENDARGWSLSLFYKVKPRLFEKSVREGKIMYVKAEELDAN